MEWAKLEWNQTSSNAIFYNFVFFKIASMREIDRILQKIEQNIQENRFEEVETEKIELKDLSSGGEWKELHKTVCAFLNTDGGIVIIGVKEKIEKDKVKRYQFTGYNPDNESKLKLIPTLFSDKSGQKRNFETLFPASTFEVKDFMSGRVCLVFVEKLPEDQKFTFYDGIAYERILTGDSKISQLKIGSQEELKKEIADARELQFVTGATLENLDIDKLNDYINKLNRDIKVESLKADIQSALPFLTRKGFVIDGKPTLLGVLVCGYHAYDLVGGRCQVDCYVDSDVHIAKNKQILKDNIIPLMESTVGFVFRNIAIGVGYEGGGTSLPEYPEKLVREVVNNALAHRDYSSDKFVNVVIKPNVFIEIRNPGNFRADQQLTTDKPVKIRRIIPNPKTRNPKLADILKAYDRWEGRGLGMAALTNACLENQIDVPYFILRSTNDISLYVPKGKVLNEDAEQWLKGFSGWILRQTEGFELTEEEKTVLTYFWKSEQLNRVERYTIMLTPDNNHFDVIAKLETFGLIEKLQWTDSNESIHPVFVVNRILTQENFFQPLRTLFGGDFDALGKDYKEVLDAIYMHNQYSMEKEVSAKAMDLFIYTRKNKAIRDFRDYDNYSRKVRNIMNALERKGFIRRTDGQKPRFVVNQDYVRTPSLFDADK